MSHRYRSALVAVTGLAMIVFHGEALAQSSLRSLGRPIAKVPYEAANLSEVKSESQRDQECMICHDQVAELPPGGSWAYVIAWGSNECEGVSQFADNCVRCDEFDHWANPNDCGEDGEDSEGPFPVESWAENEQNLWGCATVLCNDNGLPPMAEIVELSRAMDVDALVSIMRRSNGALYLNEERSAIQAVGCGGKLVMHVPVSADFAVAVSEQTGPPANPARFAGLAILSVAGAFGLGATKRRRKDVQ